MGARRKQGFAEVSKSLRKGPKRAKSLRRNFALFAP